MTLAVTLAVALTVALIVGLGLALGLALAAAHALPGLSLFEPFLFLSLPLGLELWVPGGAAYGWGVGGCMGVCVRVCECVR